MALYQGEDIAISLTGDTITNLNNNDFVMLLSPKLDDMENIIIQGNKFVYIEENDCYIYSIPKDVTTNMLGIYDMEIKIQNIKEPKNISIFKKENAIFIERSKVKDIDIEQL